MHPLPKVPRYLYHSRWCRRKFCLCLHLWLLSRCWVLPSVGASGTNTYQENEKQKKHRGTRGDHSSRRDRRRKTRNGGFHWAAMATKAALCAPACSVHHLTYHKNNCDSSLISQINSFYLAVPVCLNVLLNAAVLCVPSHLRHRISWRSQPD